MEKILAARRQIYDQFHGSKAGPAHFFMPANADAYAAYYTSMYLIADTGESVWDHRQRDFSSDPMVAYLEFWGIMQAIAIQQDSIIVLHKSIVGAAPVIASGSAWDKLRDFRHQSAGHPVNRSRGVPAPQRAFMGRMPRSWAHVQYELWDAQTGQTTHPIVDLGKMVDNYDIEASQILQTALQTMRTKWP